MGCIFVAMVCALFAISDPIYWIPVIIAGWVATITFRFYRHHIKCFVYIQTLHAQTCPHCGKHLAPGQKNEIVAASEH
jgi:hypothetical protein